MRDGAEFGQRAAELAERLRQGMETIRCIDSHTGGEPTRVIVGGLPPIEGSTITEKAEYFREHHDPLQKAVTAEPRGRMAMHTFILCPPSTEEADFGVIITCALGYLGMCGHGLIGTVTTAIEMGLIDAVEPMTSVVVETPSGLMHTQAKVEGGKVREVTFRNQSAFAFESDIEVEIPDVGKVFVDVAYGGNWFAVVDAARAGIQLGMSHLNELSRVNDLILDALSSRVRPVHPVLGEDVVQQVVFMGPPSDPKADSMNVVTSKGLGFDRSPCGTGSSAKMAVLHAKKALELNQDHVHESGTTGSLFTGRLVEETMLGDYVAVVPEITGSAYLTGVNDLWIDPQDPLRYGFSVP